MHAQDVWRRRQAERVLAGSFSAPVSTGASGPMRHAPPSVRSDGDEHPHDFRRREPKSHRGQVPQHVMDLRPGEAVENRRLDRVQERSLGWLNEVLADLKAKTLRVYRIDEQRPEQDEQDARRPENGFAFARSHELPYPPAHGVAAGGARVDDVYGHPRDERSEHETTLLRQGGREEQEPTHGDEYPGATRVPPRCRESAGGGQQIEDHHRLHQGHARILQVCEIEAEQNRGERGCQHSIPGRHEPEQSMIPATPYITTYKRADA